MLARLLQLLILAHVTLAAAWFGWFQATRPELAVVGALAIVLATAWVSALEFAGVHFAGRDPAVKPPSWRQTVHAWWRELGCMLWSFGWQQAVRSAAVPDHLPPEPNGRRGVVLIHGFVCNRGIWNSWLRELRASDHAFVAVNLEPVFGSIDDYVNRIEAAVRRVTLSTGVAPLLVCHSMGGLAARAWLRRQSDARRVARIVTIGTPHHGTALARLHLLPLGINARQMRLNSPWLRELEAEEASTKATRYGRFVCYYGHADNVVFPASTATLHGADNRHVPGTAHLALLFDARVRRETLAWLQDTANA